MPAPRNRHESTPSPHHRRANQYGGPVVEEPVRPDLDGASVAGLVPGLLAHPRHSWLPAIAREAKNVVLLVLDGFGWHCLEDHPELLPTICSMQGGHITTVVPSTTSTALTSIATGLAPAQHGLLGYRIVLSGSVFNVLRWEMPNGKRPPDPFDVQRHTPFLGREVPVVTRSEFRATGFTQAHLRGGRFMGWQTVATLVEHCCQLAEAGEPLVYAYYPGVDSVAHEFGLRGPYWRRELRFVDDLVAALLEGLPPETALLVTSDHGQVHLEREDWMDLRALGSLVDMMAGDGRFRYLYAQRGGARELAEAAREIVGDHAWVFTRREILEDGWIGSGATGTIPGRLGDVVLASKDTTAFIDPKLPNEAKLRSGHGSLTRAEMLVPLVAATGRRG
ncbi:MAG: putative superfamily protein [Actinomycetia bacterium]|nr:putative superfamily protein [Actinomycetes bacterium]